MHTQYKSFRLPVRHIQVPASAVLPPLRRDTWSDVLFRPHGTASVTPGSFHHRQLSPSIHQWICSPEVFRSGHTDSGFPAVSAHLCGLQYFHNDHTHW